MNSIFGVKCIENYIRMCGDGSGISSEIRFATYPNLSIFLEPAGLFFIPITFIGLWRKMSYS